MKNRIFLINLISLFDENFIRWVVHLLFVSSSCKCEYKLIEIKIYYSQKKKSVPQFFFIIIKNLFSWRCLLLTNITNLIGVYH